MEATGAPAGEWLYTVTSVKVPYENFAYSVSIGKGGRRFRTGEAVPLNVDAFVTDRRLAIDCGSNSQGPAVSPHRD